MTTVNYWDLSPRERGILTHEQVSAFIDYELMRKGVLVVAPPPLLPVVTIETRTIEYFAVKEFYGSPKYAFSTMAAAEAFLALRPLVISSDWETDAKLAQHTDLAIVLEQVMDETEHQRVKVLLKKNKEAKRANESAQAEYEKAVKAQDTALEGMWADWYDQREKEQSARATVKLLDEYVARCKGDRAVALQFLELVKPKQDILDAHEWLGVESPYGVAPQYV